MSLLVDIEKRLGNFMLRSKFEASSGTMALLGASGCGKSVTLRCIAGIMTPDSGRIVLDGETLFDSEKHIDLTPQQRRVALARILASEPRVILLDEPFSAPDTFLKWNLELELADLLADFPGPILWVSHDLGECYRNCKTVCVMENGRFRCSNGYAGAGSPSCNTGRCTAGRLPQFSSGAPLRRGRPTGRLGAHTAAAGRNRAGYYRCPGQRSHAAHRALQRRCLPRNPRFGCVDRPPAPGASEHPAAPYRAAQERARRTGSDHPL